MGIIILMQSEMDILEELATKAICNTSSSLIAVIATLLTGGEDITQATQVQA
jgi:hypothetical protein